jgi:membrane associated rhomboid family serine protease
MPNVSITSVLLALNVVIFGLMLASGIDPMRPSIDSLIQWGANYGPKTTQGEWWRLFTCMFLHIGILHLLFNMLALWNVGGFMERLLGSTGFVVLYLLAGLLGSVASVAWNPFVVSLVPRALFSASMGVYSPSWCAIVTCSSTTFWLLCVRILWRSLAITWSLASSYRASTWLPTSGGWLVDLSVDAY